MISTGTLALMALSYSPMSNKKLQKICYYIYSWYLAVYEKPIAETEFEAWVHGPVSPRIYDLYKRYGWNDIPQYVGFLPVEDEVIRFAFCVCNYYNQFSADQLEAMTHQESPWLKAREGLKSYESSKKIISDYDIMVFYQKETQLRDRIFKIESI